MKFKLFTLLACSAAVSNVFAPSPRHAPGTSPEYVQKTSGLAILCTPRLMEALNEIDGLDQAGLLSMLQTTSNRSLGSMHRISNGLWDLTQRATLTNLYNNLQSLFLIN